jgi:hypothetical protein
MTSREVTILNSLVTFAAENMPGELDPVESEVAKIVGTWALDGIPVRQVCPYCGEIAPHDEGRRPWLRWHIQRRAHRWMSDVRFVFNRL